MSEEEKYMYEHENFFLKVLYDILEILLPALVFVALLFTFFLRTAQVDGKSMLDTLQDKDRLVVVNCLFEPSYEDIVIVNRNHAGECAVVEPLIKRVIGLPGDTIRVTSDTVYRNDKPLNQPYIHYPNIPEGMTVVVPEGQVFVMGDHRDNSNDSRSLGCFAYEDIIGKAVYRFYPNRGNVYSNME